MSDVQKRILIGVIAGLMLYYFVWPKSGKNPARRHTAEDQVDSESPAQPVSKQVPATATAPEPKQTAVATKSPTTLPAERPQSPPNQDSEPGSLSIEDFARKFRARDFNDWLKESKKYWGHAIPHDQGLNIGHESGVIRVGEKAIQYRYEFSGKGSSKLDNNTCASFLPEGGELQMGMVHDGSLQVYKGPMDLMHILAINNKDYFVRYWEKQAFPSPRENSEPRDPNTMFTILYYQRQPDGKITYQGKLERLSSADPNFRLSGHDYCRYSFGPEYESRWDD